MIQMYKTVGMELQQLTEAPDKGCWINLIAPSESEIGEISTNLGIREEFLRYALDEEERSRIEVEDDQALIIINVPLLRSSEDIPFYDTIPLGIIISENHVITVCLEATELLSDLCSGSAKSFFTFKKTRFLLQVLFRTASLYLKYLRQIDKKTSEIERQLHQSMKNEELIKLLQMEKSLVYFITSLKSNEIVMERLLRSRLMSDAVQGRSESALLKLYAEDKELLEDVIIENKQAIEMSETYSNILSGMMDAFASVISNNLNIVMKFLASITIVVSIPGIIAAFFGMNVDLPLAHSPHAFLYTILLSIATTTGGVALLFKKKMF